MVRYWEYQKEAQWETLRDCHLETYLDVEKVFPKDYLKVSWWVLH